LKTKKKASKGADLVINSAGELLFGLSAGSQRFKMILREEFVAQQCKGGVS
jgi:hypothetical protein